MNKKNLQAAFPAIFLLISSCVFDLDKNSKHSVKGSENTKGYNYETPPWGNLNEKNQIWIDGRKIIGSPESFEMKDLFIELGFFEVSREEMIHWISNKRNFSRNFVIGENYLKFKGDGVSSELEIQRYYDKIGMKLNVIVKNSSGWNTNKYWRYLIRYSRSKNKWIFEEIEFVTMK